MQGIFVDGQRPKSKKAIKEAVSDNPQRVSVEATSMFGNEFGGRLTEWDGHEITFVGPDPYNKRNFYGAITKKQDGTFAVK